MKGAAADESDESDKYNNILYNKNLPLSIMVQVWSSWL